MRPDLSLAQIASDVGARQNLDAFTDSKDPAADVRAVLSWSYRQLDEPAARMFRLAGLHPGPSLDRYAAAALSSTTAGQAEQARAHHGLAHTYQATGDTAKARHHNQQALTQYTDLGAPEARSKPS
jgi:hypothetical protein